MVMVPCYKSDDKHRTMKNAMGYGGSKMQWGYGCSIMVWDMDACRALSLTPLCSPVGIIDV